MLTKINFAPEGTLENNEYILDYGLGYSLERGFGWVTQSSLDKANTTPININENTRDRNESDDSVTDSLIHLQYPVKFANIQPFANPNPSAWEYNLDNGQYLVTVSVGDPTYLNSNHFINIEGNSVISGFIPREHQKFTTATTLVEIDDSKLTIDAIGGFNTKLNFVEITPVEAVQVNFGLTGNTLDGYIQDSGSAYDDSRGFGWITEASIGTNQTVPLDISLNTRSREDAAPNSLATLTHLQYVADYNNPNSQTTAAAWEYELNNGQYLVEVNVGDANYTDSNHVINVEGNKIISGFTPTASQLFQSGSKIVNVQDGKLTLDAIGGFNTKINSINITSVALIDNNASELNFPENAIKINFGTSTTSAPTGFIQDIGQGFDDHRGYGWVTQDSLTTGQPQAIDLLTNVRDRHIVGTDSNSLSESLIHLQYPTALDDFNDSVTTAAVWEYELANGQYEVTVSVGDHKYTDSNHVINIENQNAITGFSPSASELFATGTAIVDVTDGKLTIDAIGGDNTKLNYLSILPIDSDFGS